MKLPTTFTVSLRIIFFSSSSNQFFPPGKPLSRLGKDSPSLPPSQVLGVQEFGWSPELILPSRTMAMKSNHFRSSEIRKPYLHMKPSLRNFGLTNPKEITHLGRKRMPHTNLLFAAVETDWFLLKYTYN